MSIKRFGATVAVAGALALPLAACGSSSAPAPTVAVTSAPTTLSPGFRDSYCNINSSTKDACRQSDSTARQQQAPASTSTGIPWWAWVLIALGGSVGALIAGVKLMEWNDDRAPARASARLAELEARYPDRDDDVEDYPEDYDDEDFEEDEDPRAPVQAPAFPPPPAGGGSLLSSLRQQGN
jgi:hypothetical protein